MGRQCPLSLGNGVPYSAIERRLAPINILRTKSLSAYSNKAQKLGGGGGSLWLVPYLALLSSMSLSSPIIPRTGSVFSCAMRN
jgi:hypothetical protein